MRLRQREPRYENRKLLDLAHRIQECVNCGYFSEHGCEPAHENGLEAGKGMSTKSHDGRHAALCHSCHVWYDIGHSRALGDKQEMWNRAHKRTFDIYWRNGWIKVAS